MTDTSIRKWIDVTESNLRNIITSTWKRANRHQLIKTSHFESYFLAMHDQELPTKYLKKQT